MDIASGQPQQHPNVLPLDPSPAPDPVTPRFGEGTQQGGVMPTTAMFAEQAAAGTADCADAMSAGMAAEGARRQHYADAMSPLGAGATDEMVLPVVPSAAVPPAASDAYPYSGDEPTPAG